MEKFKLSAIALFSLCLINGENIRNSVDIEAKADISTGILKYKGKTFNFIGSRHTPKGLFKFNDPTEDGPNKDLALPFLTIPIEQTPTDNPQYELHKRLRKQGVSKAAYVIHEYNLKPGEISSGCLLVNHETLKQILNLYKPGDSIQIN